jgi:hypothetical protein
MIILICILNPMHSMYQLPHISCHKQQSSPETAVDLMRGLCAELYDRVDATTLYVIFTFLSVEDKCKAAAV